MNEIFKIRKATNVDTDNIILLVKSILPEFGLTYSPSTSESDLRNIEKIYTKNGGTFLVVETNDGRIIGTIALLRIDHSACKLRKMYIDKMYRGIGLGVRLLKAALLKAKELNFNEVYLETVHSMTSAIKLYEKYGFERVNKSATSPRCDITMKLSLEV